jgi:uncharacterized protein YigE (DUF2233 family)
MACLVATGCSPSDSQWVSVGSGLDIRVLNMTTDNPITSVVTRPRVSLVRASLQDVRLGVVRAEDGTMAVSDVATLRQKTRALALVNANFFDERHQPLGLVMSNGVVRNKLHRGGNLLTGLFVNRGGKYSIIGREEFSLHEVIDAIQAGPRIIISGIPAILSGQLSRSRRAGICIDKQSRIILYATTSLMGGVTLAEIQNFLLQPDINCQDALNFDGGGSAQLSIDPELIKATISSAVMQNTLVDPRLNLLTAFEVQGDDQVPVAVGVFSR